MEELRKVEEDTRIEKIKKHILENRKTYVGIAVGVIGTAVIMKKFCDVKIIANDIETVGILNVIQADKIDHLHQRISNYGKVIGRPGKPVWDMTTLKKYESEKLAAIAIGVSQSRMSNHLKGKTEHLNGHIFEFANSIDK